MTDYTWTGAANANWTNGANWSGGTGSDHPDDNADKAIFNSGSVDCSMNAASLTVGEISITSGYSGTITQFGPVTVDSAGAHNGDLTIGGGTWNTLGSSTSHALTVTGETEISAGTLTCNASTVNVGSYQLSGSASGATTIDAGGTLQVNKRNPSGWGFTLDNGTFTNNGELIIAFDGTNTAGGNVTSTFMKNGLGTNHGKLTVNCSNSSHTVYIGRFSADPWLAGDVTVTSGNLSANEGTTNQNTKFASLTIESNGEYEAAPSGTTTITSKASTNFAFKNEGTFTPNSGTMQIGDGSTSTGGAHLMNTTYHNLTINRDQNAPDGNTPWRPSSGSEVTIAGNLTVTKGRFYRNSSSNSLVVAGDVDIAANGQVGTEAASGSNTFGSLTISSGGTYLATSGTTTINGDPGGYPNLGINLDGTFTHNNGTLKYTGGSGGLDLASTGNLYNFEHAPTGTTFITNNTTIENNLTMTGANFQGVNGNENLTVKGNVTINSSGQTMNFNGSSEHTFGFLTILDGTYKVQNGTGGFTKVGGIRNVGGTVSNAV